MKILLVLTILLTINFVSGNDENVENEENLLFFNKINITEYLYEIANNLTLRSVDYNETLCGYQLLYWLGVLVADQEIWALKSKCFFFL